MNYWNYNSTHFLFVSGIIAPQFLDIQWMINIVLALQCFNGTCLKIKQNKYKTVLKKILKSGVIVEIIFLIRYNIKFFFFLQLEAVLKIPIFQILVCTKIKGFWRIQMTRK